MLHTKFIKWATICFIKLNKGNIKMHKILLLSFTCLLLIACSSTPKAPSIAIKNFHTKAPAEKIFSLIGVDGKPHKGKPILAGSHIFYIEGFEVDEEDATQVIYSLHAMRVRLNENNQYSIKSKALEGVLHVWLNNDTTNERASSISSLTQSSLDVFTRDPDIELITINEKQVSFLDKTGTNNCQFRMTVSNQNKGFDDSITDKKLPDRFNQPRCN